MEEFTLAGLFDEDREMLLANLNRDRSPAAAQAALERAVDRVMYRYVESAQEPVFREGAQQILQAVKNALPVMDCISEARVWKNVYEPGSARGISIRPATVIPVLAGLVLILGAVAGVLIAGRTVGADALLKAILPVVFGCALLLWGGFLTGRPQKQKRHARAQENGDTRTEILVDTEKLIHALRGTLLQCDGQLDLMRQNESLRKQDARQTPEGTDTLPQDELDLFGELLEKAYAGNENSALEGAADIRFYLHNRGVDVLDYEKGQERFFEFLPASRPGTIRPAMMSQGRLLRKGLASSVR
ncbi:MAG: hypothetical protein IJH38_08935 [Clostridia bacterium]|nr:hypothetical protein [Clostridia bacterium]